MSNIESNKMIAEFMGYKYFPFDETKKSSNPDIIVDQMSGWHKPTNGHYKIPDWYLCRTHKELAYDRKWDWLMPVINEIEWTKAEVTIRGTTCNIWHSELKYYQTEGSIYIDEPAMTKFEATYRAVVEYIEWYNLNS